MAPTNEAALVAAIRKRVRKEHPGTWDLKVHGGPMQRPGVPDLLFCVMGYFVAMEVKYQRPGESHGHALGRVSDAQHEQLTAISLAGGIAGAVTSEEGALELVETAVQRHRAHREG